MIGIIGKGFVGSAIFASYDDAIFFDPFVEGSVLSIKDLLKCDAIFVCVPTPIGRNGDCDDSILQYTFLTLKELGYNGLVISKSTAPFESYAKWEDELSIAFVPEFLRAATAIDDYLASEFMIIGAKHGSVQNATIDILQSSKLAKLKTFKKVSIKEACLIKYFENSFLATKVSLMNEFYTLCEKVGANWDNVISGLALDQRIGEDHTQVPGPDGKFGWGGHCFPKDTAALLHLAKKQDVDLLVLNQAIESNKKIRMMYE